MFERAPRSTILVHTTTQYVRVAVLERSTPETATISDAAEFAIDDEESLKQWVEEHANDGPGWVAGYCGFQPSGSMLIREDLVVREPPPKLDAIAPPWWIAGLAVIRKKAGVLASLMPSPENRWPRPPVPALPSSWRCRATK